MFDPAVMLRKAFEAAGAVYGSLTKFASQVGSTQPDISRIKNGDRPKSLKLIRDIEQAADKIPAGSLTAPMVSITANTLADVGIRNHDIETFGPVLGNRIADRYAEIRLQEPLHPSPHNQALIDCGVIRPEMIHMGDGSKPKP